MTENKKKTLTREAEPPSRTVVINKPTKQYPEEESLTP